MARALQPGHTRHDTTHAHAPQFALRAASVAVLRLLACPPCFLLGGRDGRRESTCACTLSRRGARARLPCLPPVKSVPLSLALPPRRRPERTRAREARCGGRPERARRSPSSDGGIRSIGASKPSPDSRTWARVLRNPVVAWHQQPSAARMRRIGQWPWPWTRLQTPHCFDFPPRETNRLDRGVASGGQIVGPILGGAQAANTGADDMMSHQRFTAWRRRRQICHVR